jgi:hypothetical protein
LVKAMKATRQRPATAQWGMFLRNHDELDLGRLTERQRQEVFAAFGRSPACSSTTVVFVGGLHPCSMATTGGWSSPTA